MQLPSNKADGEQDASCNHYQPLCFDDFPQFQHQPRDRRAPPLVVVHALIVRRRYEHFTMKLPERPILAALVLAVALCAILYGYRRARAERHQMFEAACAAGDSKRVTLLLRLGADPNGHWDSYYYVRYAWTVFESTPPLHLAASGGHADVVRLLLSHGANPTARAIEQMTARDFARHEGHAEVVQILDDAHHK